MNNLKFSDVSFSYEKNNSVLENISFTIEQGEKVGLIGANGAGKSTLLKLIVGLEKFDTGEIIVDDKLVKKENYIDIRKKVGYVFQDSDNQLFMNNVKEEVSFALYNSKWEEDKIKREVDNILDELDITSLKNRSIIKLSGGEKKLVSMACVLVMKPEILLLDEPTNNLDPRYRRKVIEILNSINCTKIIASHDFDMISKTCDKIIMINKGKIVKIGNTDEILQDHDLMLNNGLF